MNITFRVPAMLAVFSLAAGAALIARQAPQADEALMKKAKAIHERILTVDTHVDIGGADYATPKLDPGGPTNLKCDLPKMKAGGLDGVFLAVFVGQRPDLNAEGYKRAYDSAMAEFDALDRLRTMHPELCEFGRTPADVERIAKDGEACHPHRRRERVPDGRFVLQPEDVLRSWRALHDARAHGQ